MSFTMRSMVVTLCAFFIAVCPSSAPAQADAEALLQAAGKWEVNEVKSLISKGVNVDAPGEHGWPPLIAAVRGADPRFAKQDAQTEVVRVLLENGARVDGKDKEGRTALMNTHMPGVAGLLLKKGANLEEVDKNGLTPLMWQARHFGVAFKGHVSTLRLLLEKGASVNKVDNEGMTALMWACRKGNRESVELLLKHGADVNAKDRSGQAALMHLKENKFVDAGLPRGDLTAEELLIQHGASK